MYNPTLEVSLASQLLNSLALLEQERVQAAPQRLLLEQLAKEVKITRELVNTDRRLATKRMLRIGQACEILGLAKWVRWLEFAEEMSDHTAYTILGQLLRSIAGVKGSQTRAFKSRYRAFRERTENRYATIHTGMVGEDDRYGYVVGAWMNSRDPQSQGCIDVVYNIRYKGASANARATVDMDRVIELSDKAEMPDWARVRVEADKRRDARYRRELEGAGWTSSILDSGVERFESPSGRVAFGLNNAFFNKELAKVATS